MWTLTAEFHQNTQHSSFRLSFKHHGSVSSLSFTNTFWIFPSSSQTFQWCTDAVVKWYCSKCFCWEQRFSFQMDGGPCSPCGVWFLISVSRQWCKLTGLQRTIYLSLQHSSGELLKGSNRGQRRKQWHGADNDTIQYSRLKMAVLSSRISYVGECCDSHVKNKYSP